MRLALSLLLIVCLAPRQSSGVITQEICDRANNYYRATRNVEGYARIVTSGYTDFTPELEWLAHKGA